MAKVCRDRPCKGVYKLSYQPPLKLELNLSRSPLQHRRIITCEIRRKPKKRPRKCALVRARDKYLVVQWRLQGIPRLFHPDSYRKVVCGGCGDPYENYLT